MNSTEYNLNMEKSFFSKDNFYGQYSPSNLDKNMISCSNIIQFHYDTSFILNFISSLYYEIKKQETDFNYNIKKFGDLIENLNIQISNQSSSSLSSLTLSLSSNTFTFFYKKFESGADNQNELYSSIPENQKPYFGQYGNILIPSTYINNYGLNYNHSYNKKNINSYKSECKFREVLDEILKQKPENILGYLTYKIIYYNIIIYNINIQNSVRINYLNKPLLTYNEISIVEPLTPQIDDIRSVINDNVENIKELNRRFFINTQNDYLMEKNRYREKINSLNTIKDDFIQSQDKFNKSIRNYKYNINNYDMIKKYSKYVAYSLIFMIIIVIILIYFNENLLFIIFIISMIILIYLFSQKFKYINERFVGDTTINILKLGYNINNISFNSNIFFEDTNNILLDEKNRFKLIFNDDKFSIEDNEIRAEAYLFIGKSYTMNDNLRNINSFYNYDDYPYNMVSKKYVDISSIQNLFTDFIVYNIFSRSSMTQLFPEDSIYILSDYSRPNSFYYKLNFENGEAIEGITPQPPIVIVLFTSLYLGSNRYLVKRIFILNGGYGYKVLPTVNNNIDIFYETINNPIDFNKYLSKNYYNIIKYEIINKGLYISPINNNKDLIPESCSLNITYTLNNDRISTFRTNIDNIITQINNTIEEIDKIKTRASTTISTSLLISLINTSKTTTENYITYINNNLSLANCIINKLLGISNQQPLIEGCDNGTLITINNFQIQALAYVKSSVYNLKIAIEYEAEIIIDKIDEIKNTYNSYGINTDFIKTIKTDISTIKEDIKSINFENISNDNIQLINEKKEDIITKGTNIFNKIEEIRRRYSQNILTYNKSTDLNNLNSNINYVKTKIDIIKNRNNVVDINNNQININSNLNNFNINKALIECIYNKLEGSTLPTPTPTGCSSGTTTDMNNKLTEAEEYVKTANKELINAIYTEANILLTYINNKFRIDYNLNNIINEMYNNISNITNPIFNDYKTKFEEIKTYINNINLASLRIKFNTITLNKTNVVSNTILSEIVNIRNELLTLGDDIYIVKLKIQILLIIKLALEKANSIIISANQALEYATQADTNATNASQYSNSYFKTLIKYIRDIRRYAGTNIEGFTCEIDESSSALNEANTARTNVISFILIAIELLETFIGINININNANTKSQNILLFNQNTIINANTKALCYKEKTDELLSIISTYVITYRTLISSCSVRSLNPTLKNEIDKHASVYNFLVPYINNYANTIEEIMNNMRMNVLTLGNMSFIMDKNIYLYELYLKKKKEITEFKLKFTEYVNKTELVRSNSRDLYHFIIFLIITYIIIIIGIYIYLYLIPSLLIVIIFVIIMIIIVIIFFTFKLGVSTRMLADKYYWSMMTLKKID